MTKIKVSGFDTVKVTSDRFYVSLDFDNRWLTMNPREAKALRKALKKHIKQVVSRG